MVEAVYGDVSGRFAAFEPLAQGFVDSVTRDAAEAWINVFNNTILIIYTQKVRNVCSYKTPGCLLY